MMPQDPDLVRVVHAETGEALDALLELSESLIAGSTGASEYVRTAFRIFHNVKGALRLAGFPGPERLAHAVEDRLAELRESGESPSEEFVDAIEQALSTCLKAVEAGGAHPDLNAVFERIAGLGESGVTGAQPLKSERAANGSSIGPSTLGPAVESAAAAPGPKALRIDATRLDRLMDLGSEYLAQHGRQRRQRAALRDFADRLTLLVKREQRLKHLLLPLMQDFDAFVRAEEQDLRRAGQLTADFDGAMRGVRMQPLSVIVPQLRRVVSEASRELGKSAHLSLDFGDVEIDRQVLDALREPLMHLLRNAVDHGIEHEAVRSARQKPARGEVCVSARLKGVNVEIEVSDDGAGIDLEKVRARALEQGFLAADEAQDPTRLLDATLFAPGFSTATKVTTVSGRGVGLDVVRARVAELGGQVYATLGQTGTGASFTLSVPASVVSLRGLAVRAGGATFVLPSAQIERTLRIGASQLGSAEGVTVVRTPEGDPLRLRWLSSAMGLERSDDPDFLQVLVVAEGLQRLGLVVDEVQGDTNFVIKRLPWNIRRAQGVIGATHQGDATLALVVDPTHLFRAQNTTARDHRVKLATKQQRTRILVADDSLTSRTLERNILVSAGYEVQVVEDGEYALEALEHQSFDLLVSDVQMPRMDGFELTRRVRTHARLSKLPIILVTSLDRPEDVAEGARVGADEYIIKGQFDQEILLKTVSRLL